MLKLTTESEELLKANGWRQGLRSSADQIKGVYLANRCPLNVAALEFLLEFGNIAIGVANSSSSLSPPATDFDLTIERAAKYRITAARWSESLGRELSPVGHADRGHCVLLMAGDGMTYLEDEESIFVVGHDGSDAINALVHGRPLTRVFIEENEDRAPERE